MNTRQLNALTNAELIAKYNKLYSGKGRWRRQANNLHNTLPSLRNELQRRQLANPELELLTQLEH